MSHNPRHLTTEEIEATLSTMRANPGKCWTSRGRGGKGLQFRDGQFWTISIDEGHERTHPFTDEVAVYTWLAKLDVARENLMNRYYRAILQEMGTLPSGAN